MRFRWRDLAILKKATQYCGLLAYLYQTGCWKNVRIDLLIVLPSRCQVSARWKPRRSSKIWLHTKVNALIRYFLTHCCSYSRMPKSFGSKNLEFEPCNNFFFFALRWFTRTPRSTKWVQLAQILLGQPDNMLGGMGEW